MEMFQRCPGVVPVVFRKCLNVASEVFQGYSGGIQEVFRRHPNIVPELFQKAFRRCSKLFQNCSKLCRDILAVFQSCSKIVRNCSVVLWMCYKVVSELLFSYLTFPRPTHAYIQHWSATFSRFDH